MYKIFIKSVSRDKESSALEISQATYPPNAVVSTSVDILDASRIHVRVQSEPGTGGVVEVFMNTTDVVPRLVTKSFAPDLTFDFVNLKPGGFYQFLATSYSVGGELRPSREFSPVSEVTFPGVPQEYSYSPVLTDSSVSVGFFLEGKYDGWNIQLVRPSNTHKKHCAKQPLLVFFDYRKREKNEKRRKENDLI